MAKKTVVVLYGGRSTEHEISLISAQNIISNLNRELFDVICIGIDKVGQWFFHGHEPKLKNPQDPKTIKLESGHDQLLFSQNANDHGFYKKSDGQLLARADIIFPILHGVDGEDGALQGLCQLANIPCVGPGVLSSAICMDKEVMKRLFHYSGIPNAEFVTVYKHKQNEISYSEIRQKLGKELFVKPVNLGSSVGVSFVKSEDDFLPAIEHAFKFDTKVIIEKRLIGREVECAVLGNEYPKSSIAGEVKPKDGFYSYETKYIDEHGADLMVPAKLTDEQLAALQDTAIKAYEVMECSGLARVDMFLSPDNQIFVNELNTLPGFTSISMYPKLWEHSGMSITELLTELVHLAVARHLAKDELLKSV